MRRFAPRTPLALLAVLAVLAALVVTKAPPRPASADAPESLLAVNGTLVAPRLTAGDAQSCLVRADRTVACWFHDGAVTRGVGEPVAVIGITDAVGVAADRDQACAVNVPGELWCWDPDLEAPVASQVLLPVATTAVALGRAHACVLAEDGSVWCWGDDGWGQLGRPGGSSPEPGQVVDLPPAQAITAAGDHTCALLTSGAVSCWGFRRGGVEVAPPDEVPHAPAPHLVDGLENAVALTGGSAHNCALDAAGTVWCWGWNVFGMLGDDRHLDDLMWDPIPRPVEGLTEVVAITADGPHTCALDSGGKVWCWGFNISGQLGRPGTDRDSTPTQVPGIDHAIGVVAGESSTCAIESAGTITCWGVAATVIDDFAMVASDDAGQTHPRSEVVIDVAANDTFGGAPVDPTLMEIAVTEGPNLAGSAVLVAVDGAIVYRAGAGTGNDETDSLTYRICERGGLACDSAHVTIDIAARPFVVNPDEFIIEASTTERIYVLANDEDPDRVADPGSVSILSSPDFGTATVDQADPGVIVFAAPDHSVTVTFIYQVCYVVGRCSLTTVTVTVISRADCTVDVGADDFSGGATPDIICADGGSQTIAGGPGDDIIFAGGGDDVIDGGDGDDIIFAGDGNDMATGGNGDDWVAGGPDDDDLDGRDGHDVVHGGDGHDKVRGGPWSDVLFGGPGHDRLHAGEGDDVSLAGDGDDAIRGGNGFDNVDGGPGVDECLEVAVAWRCET